MGDVLLLTHDAWLPALLYLIVSMAGGSAVILFGDWLGQWCLHWVQRQPGRRTSRTLTQPLKDRSGSVDIDDDDLLLPEQEASRSRQ
ncbi:hypothetical protein KSD_53910 [Ktedonobacter sp. SOSP1-85]|nr:hypothetical protein KSD_53910 [Ktedonobacter sp. SOSP1-85]